MLVVLYELGILLLFFLFLFCLLFGIFTTQVLPVLRLVFCLFRFLFFFFVFASHGRLIFIFLFFEDL